MNSLINMLRKQKHRLPALLLIPALAFGPIGCGAEVVVTAPVVMTGIASLGVALGFCQKYKEAEAAVHDAETKQFQRQKAEAEWQDYFDASNIRINRGPSPVSSPSIGSPAGPFLPVSSPSFSNPRPL
jgi:hypothetical protein